MGGHAYICQDCVRSLPEAPSIPCMTRDTVCVCVCVCVCLACSPHPPLRLTDVHCSLILLLGCGHAYMCLDCIQSLHEAPSTLCIAGDTVCVCVYVCPCLLPHPPMHPVLPMFIAHQFNLWGARPTCVKIVSDLCPRLHPSCVSRATLCVCVCVFLLLHAPPPPSASSRCS